MVKINPSYAPAFPKIKAVDRNTKTKRRLSMDYITQMVFLQT